MNPAMGRTSSAAATADRQFNVSKRGAPKEAAILAESPTVGVTPEYDVPGGRTPPHSPADTVVDTEGQDSITRSGGSVSHSH